MSDSDDREYKDEEDVESPLKQAPKVVQLDGLVLLKIIKHCQEHVPDVVTGQLLGLDVDNRLEVTNCFPFPSSEGDDEGDDYQIDMMKCLRTVNVDNNTVGWYQSAFLGSFLNSSIVEAQYTYQKEIPCSVVVVHDPFSTAKGRLALKAYRLTDAFMDMYAKGSYSQRSFAEFDVSSSEILEEIPIKVHNSHLVHAFLYELREHNTSGGMQCHFDRLSLTANPFVEKNLGIMADCIDQYAADQAKFMFHQRQVGRQRQSQQAFKNKRSQENENRKKAGQEPLPEVNTSKNPLFKPIAPPSRMDSYLLSNQINHYCTQISSSASQAFQKLYVAESLMKSTSN
jgi:translation initiation factor 3 subunit H